jgi:hypothetical protein
MTDQTFSEDSGEGEFFTIRFADSTGQIYEATIDQCTFPKFTGAPGDRVTIDYFSGNPTQIVPHNENPPGITYWVLFLLMPLVLALVTFVLQHRRQAKK